MKLHHVNVVSEDVPGLIEFYRDDLGLASVDLPVNAELRNMYARPFAFMNAGDAQELQLHLCGRDMNVGFRNGHAVNPVAHGHVAFRTSNIERVKRRLNERGIPYADFGVWAIEGWYQIYLCDPAGTVLEIHEVL